MAGKTIQSIRSFGTAAAQSVSIETTTTNGRKLHLTTYLYLQLGRKKQETSCKKNDIAQ